MWPIATFAFDLVKRCKVFPRSPFQEKSDRSHFDYVAPDLGYWLLADITEHKHPPAPGTWERETRTPI